MKKYIFKFSVNLNRFRFVTHASSFESAVDNFRNELEENQIAGVKNYSCISKPVVI